MVSGFQNIASGEMLFVATQKTYLGLSLCDELKFEKEVSVSDELI